MERAAVFACGYFLLGGPRLVTRQIGGHQQKALQLAIQLLNAAQLSLDKFDGRDFATFEQGRDVGDGGGQQIRHRCHVCYSLALAVAGNNRSIGFFRERSAQPERFSFQCSGTLYKYFLRNAA